MPLRSAPASTWGRSPADRYIVKDENTKDLVWWKGPEGGGGNQPIDNRCWAELKATATSGVSNERVYVIDGFCGSSPGSRIKVRFIASVPWQAHFVKNMFLRPEKSELEGFVPDFTVINSSASSFRNWKKHGLNSSAYVAINLTEKLMVIGGTWYAGEMKKGIFSVMNHILPQRGVASMHCSANIGEDGTTSVNLRLVRHRQDYTVIRP